METRYCVRQDGRCTPDECCISSRKPQQVLYKDSLVVNLWAGPGAGKSTTAAGLFFVMKSKGLRCELVTEFAKELTYEKRWTALGDQEFVTIEQNSRQKRLVGQVDYIITDSPLPLAEVYVRGEDAYRKRCADKAWALFNQYRNVNFFINRVKPYEPYGRRQSEESARSVDEKIQDLTAGMIDDIVPGSPSGVLAIFDHIKKLKV